MQPNATQLLTRDPQGTPSSTRLLGHAGFVSALKYSYLNPGGCDSLSCQLSRSALWRGDALNLGRQLYAVRGSTIVWAGILDEPTHSDDGGWEITAHGAGKYGDDYRAIWTGSWGTGVFNNAIDAAIGRGLPWTRNQDIGAVSGIWTGQRVDSAMQSVNDLLNLGCYKAGLTWTVTTGPGGNVVSVYPLPTAPNRILISPDPQARGIADGPSTEYVRYQSAAATDSAQAQFSLTSVTSSAEETAHGRREDVMDLSSAGTLTAGAAQAPASAALRKFQRAAFTDSFTVTHGELLSIGGTPVDLGLYWADGFAAMVCKPWLSDYAYGGESTPGSSPFIVGGYEFDQDAGTAAITALESAKHDWGALVSMVVDTMPRRHRPKSKRKKTKHG